MNEIRTLEIPISGMDCAECTQHVRHAIEKLPGVQSVNVFLDAADFVHLRTRDPHEALAALYARDRQHVFLEGGPTLAAAFLRAGLVDEVVTYVAPMLLGAGRSAVGELGVTTIADARRLAVTDVTVLGEGEETNVRLTMRPLERKEEDR
jgi:diaminohydroxyphosphoribosylaminopyrimidine deaminase/5-amino-6-(5-phosphoribosylamino)uracil reductase